MVRIPVYTQEPVTIRAQDTSRLLKMVRGNVAAGVATVVPDLGGDTGVNRNWLIHTVMITVSAPVGADDWCQFYIVNSINGEWILTERFNIPQNNYTRINLIRNGPYGVNNDLVVPSLTIFAPLPDVWLDDDYYAAVMTSAVTADFNVLYEERRNLVGM